MRKIFNIKNKGFTLLELLIVISIMGVLGSISFPAYSKAQSKSRDNKRINDMKAIKTGLNLYAEAHDGCYFTTTILTSDPANGTFEGKYVTKDLYSRIRLLTVPHIPEDSGVLGTPWSASRPYFYRSVGDFVECTMSTYIAPYNPHYQLYVELESKEAALDSDADSNMSGIIGQAFSRGIDLSSPALEVCDNTDAGNWDCVYDVSSDD